MKLDVLLSKIKLYQKIGDSNPEITSVEKDHRNVLQGSLFICIKGHTVDGHKLVAQAIENGAVAIIAEKPLNVAVPVVVVANTERIMALLANVFYQYPSRSLNLVGITGTNGKTTTSYIIEKVLVQLGKRTGLVGTMFTKILDKKRRTENTTPDSLALQKLFHEMKLAQVEHAVMEVSSHALMLGRVHGCEFKTAVFMNLASDHLDFHQTKENYQLAKSLLFSQLGNDLEDKVAILNADDAVSAFYQEITQAQVFTFAIHHSADFQAVNIRQNINGVEFDLLAPNGKYHVKSRLVGLFNVYNLLATIAVCYRFNFAMEEIIRSIETIADVPGRFEKINDGQDFTVIVDYAHTPDGLENVLKTVQEFMPKKIYSIIGCGGDRDKQKRPEMARIACELSDVAIFTTDNPRTESQELIFQDMISGTKGLGYQIIVNRKEAIEYAVNCAEAGDVIVIAGKGHEDYQIVGTKKMHFDDRETAHMAILAKKDNQKS